MPRSSLSLAPLLLLVATLALADKPRAPEQIPGVTLVSAEEVIGMILDQPDILVVDSRLEEEYAKGHIEGAINILDTTLTKNALAVYADSRDTPIIFYCNGVACMRSSNACRKAVEWGYTNIYWMRGGWTEWRQKRYPAAW